MKKVEIKKIRWENSNKNLPSRVIITIDSVDPEEIEYILQDTYSCKIRGFVIGKEVK